MFNDFCYRLNRIGLSRIAAGLRYVMYAVAGGNPGFYSSPQAGFVGWYSRRPFGVLAFLDTNGKLHFRW